MRTVEFKTEELDMVISALQHFISTLEMREVAVWEKLLNELIEIRSEYEKEENDEFELKNN